ncbi:AzlD domain-containing protein [Luminiphilus sp.]|jgi:branched-subunit amino acid transport protein|nr:AzlD domain-containing protein [Luminiphilus sp.]
MIVTAIILTGIGSYIMRAFFIFALARYQFPPIMLQALEYVAPTVMAALVISLLTTPNGELAAGLPEIAGLVGTAIVAKISGNHILSLITGMATYWLLGWIM